MFKLNKKWLIALIPIVAIAIWFFQQERPLGVSLENPQVIEWVKPTTDAEWAEDVKKESLDLKFDFQLTEMKENLEGKLPLHKEDLREITNCPECIRWGLRQNFEADFDNIGLNYNRKFEGKTVQDWIDGEFDEQVVSRTWEVEKVKQSIERIDNEIRLRASGFLKVINRLPPDSPERDNLKTNERSLLGTAYYIDCVNGSDADAGTATTTAFLTLNQFTENSRSAGDIVFLRRATSTANTCDDGGDLEFTSDGTISDPIVITADYDDLWSDFATSSQTVTPIFGSKFMATSASTTDMFNFHWIYLEGDCSETFDSTIINNCDFAYEIETATTTGIKLFLPYKGNQSGSGQEVREIGIAPLWNTIAGDFQWNFNQDNYWKIQGIYVRGTDSNGNIELDSTAGQVFKDVITEGNGSADFGIKTTDDFPTFYVFKSRFLNHINNIADQNGGGAPNMWLKDSLLDGNNVSNSYGIDNNVFDKIFIEETEFKNHTLGDFGINLFVPGIASFITGRNVLLSSNTQMDEHQLSQFSRYIWEDFNGTVGDNRQFTGFSIAENSHVLRSTTTPVRSGGGATSIEVLPSTKISNNSEIAYLKLFERKIYTDTTSRDYQVFFKGGTTTVEFLASPTADELWIECEYWGSATNNFRRLTKSTATVDFTTDADFDQSLTITCAPSQTGILYLRGWYAKTKESTFDNVFFVDPRIVITDT